MHGAALDRSIGLSSPLRARELQWLPLKLNTHFMEKGLPPWQTKIKRKTEQKKDGHYYCCCCRRRRQIVALQLQVLAPVSLWRNYSRVSTAVNVDVWDSYLSISPISLHLFPPFMSDSDESVWDRVGGQSARPLPCYRADPLSALWIFVLQEVGLAVPFRASWRDTVLQSLNVFCVQKVFIFYGNKLCVFLLLEVTCCLFFSYLIGS